MSRPSSRSAFTPQNVPPPTSSATSTSSQNAHFDMRLAKPASRFLMKSIKCGVIRKPSPVYFPAKKPYSQLPIMMYGAQ